MSFTGFACVPVPAPAPTPANSHTNPPANPIATATAEFLNGGFQDLESNLETIIASQVAWIMAHGEKFFSVKAEKITDPCPFDIEKGNVEPSGRTSTNCLDVQTSNIQVILCDCV